MTRRAVALAVASLTLPIGACGSEPECPTVTTGGLTAINGPAEVDEDLDETAPTDSPGTATSTAPDAC